jgi:hypothetical protein
MKVYFYTQIDGRKRFITKDIFSYLKNIDNDMLKSHHNLIPSFLYLISKKNYLSIRGNFFHKNWKKKLKNRVKKGRFGLKKEGKGGKIANKTK